MNPAATTTAASPSGGPAIPAPQVRFPLLAIGLTPESEAFLRQALTLEQAVPSLIVASDPGPADSVSGPLAGGVVEVDATGRLPIPSVTYLGARDPGAPIIALVRESVPPKLDPADPSLPIIPIPISDRGIDLLRHTLVLAEGRAKLLARLSEVEEAVERRTERFRALTLTTRVAVWDWDLSESRVWRSDGFELLFGYPEKEIDESFEWWAERIHPDDRERVVQRVAPSLSGDDDQIHNSYRFRARDGSYVRVLDSGVVLRSANNRPVRMIGTVREVDDLPNGERAVRASAQSSAAEVAMERLSAIEQVTDVTLAKLTLEDLLTELLGRLRAGLGADAALAHLLTEDGTTLMRRAWIGVGGVAPRAVEIPVGAGYSGRIAESGKPMMVEDIWVGPIVPVGRLAEFTSLLGTPLILEGKTIGVLSVLTRKRREFTQSDQSLLQIVADRVAFVVDRANLSDRLRTEHRELETLSRRLVTLQEEERHAIARELHDSAGQILTALKLALEAKRLDRNHVDSLIGELHDQLGDISMNLRPPMLDDLGLLPALRWHLKRFSSETGVNTRLHSKGVDARFRTELELAAFRIVQEALTNVVRHARADSAIVDVLCTDGVLHVRVVDAGSGFDPDAVPPGGGSGLIGMRERATLLGGIFSIQSSSGKGTSVIAELPVA